MTSLYTDYYGDPDLAAWRAAGAVDKAAHIRLMCADIQPQSVLEVGAGDGAVIERLAGFAPALHAAEISASGLAAIRARLPDVEAVGFDGRTLPFADKTFDLVYATHVLEHVEHERLFLAELMRVGRTVFLEVPLEDTVRIRRNVHNSIGHINFYNRHTFRSLVESVGLTVRDFRTFDQSLAVASFGKSPISGLVKKAPRVLARRLAPAVSEWIFGYHACILATG